MPEISGGVGLPIQQLTQNPYAGMYWYDNAWHSQDANYSVRTVTGDNAAQYIASQQARGSQEAFTQLSNEQAQSALQQGQAYRANPGAFSKGGLGTSGQGATVNTPQLSEQVRIIMANNAAYGYNKPTPEQQERIAQGAAQTVQAKVDLLTRPLFAEGQQGQQVQQVKPANEFDSSRGFLAGLLPTISQERASAYATSVRSQSVFEVGGGMIGAGIDYEKSLATGLLSNLTFWISDSVFKPKTYVTESATSAKTTVTTSGGSKEITELGNWIDTNRSILDTTNPSKVSEFNSKVSKYNELYKSNPIVTTTTTTPGTPEVRKNQWELFTEGSGRVARELTGTSLAYLDARETIVQNKEGVGGIVDRLQFGAEKFILTQPANLAPASLQAMAFVAGGELIGVGVAGIAAGTSRVAPIAQALISPTGQFTVKSLVAGTFGALYVDAVTERFTASAEKTQMNVGETLPSLAAMFVAGGGANWLGETRAVNVNGVKGIEIQGQSFVAGKTPEGKFGIGVGSPSDFAIYTIGGESKVGGASPRSASAPSSVKLIESVTGERGRGTPMYDDFVERTTPSQPTPRSPAPASTQPAMVFDTVEPLIRSTTPAKVSGTFTTEYGRLSSPTDLVTTGTRDVYVSDVPTGVGRDILPTAQRQIEGVSVRTSLPAAGETTTIWNTPMDVQSAPMWQQFVHSPVSERLSAFQEQVGKPSGITPTAWERYSGSTGSQLSLTDYRALTVAKAFQGENFEVGAIIANKGSAEGSFLGFVEGDKGSVPMWGIRKSAVSVARSLTGTGDVPATEIHRHPKWAPSDLGSPLAPSHGDIANIAQIKDYQKGTYGMLKAKGIIPSDTFAIIGEIANTPAMFKTGFPDRFASEKPVSVATGMKRSITAARKTAISSGQTKDVYDTEGIRTHDRSIQIANTVVKLFNAKYPGTQQTKIVGYDIAEGRGFEYGVGARDGYTGKTVSGGTRITDEPSNDLIFAGRSEGISPLADALQLQKLKEISNSLKPGEKEAAYIFSRKTGELVASSTGQTPTSISMSSVYKAYEQTTPQQRAEGLAFYHTHPMSTKIEITNADARTYLDDVVGKKKAYPSDNDISNIGSMYPPETKPMFEEEGIISHGENIVAWRGQTNLAYPDAMYRGVDIDKVDEIVMTMNNPRRFGHKMAGQGLDTQVISREERTTRLAGLATGGFPSKTHYVRGDVGYVQYPKPEGYRSNNQMEPLRQQLDPLEEVNPYSTKHLPNKPAPRIDLRDIYDVSTLRPANVATSAEQAMVMRQYSLTPEEITFAKRTGASLNDILRMREISKVLETDVALSPLQEEYARLYGKEYAAVSRASATATGVSQGSKTLPIMGFGQKTSAGTLTGQRSNTDTRVGSKTLPIMDFAQRTATGQKVDTKQVSKTLPLMRFQTLKDQLNKPVEEQKSKTKPIEDFREGVKGGGGGGKETTTGGGIFVPLPILGLPGGGGGGGGSMSSPKDKRRFAFVNRYAYGQGIGNADFSTGYGFGSTGKIKFKGRGIGR